MTMQLPLSDVRLTVVDVIWPDENTEYCAVLRGTARERIGDRNG